MKLPLKYPISPEQVAFITGGNCRCVKEDFYLKFVCEPEFADEESLCFVWSRKALKELKSRGCGCAVVSPNLADKVTHALCVVTHPAPREALAIFLEEMVDAPWLSPQVPPASETAFWVSSDADVDPSSRVFPFSFIAEGVKVGRGSVIFPFVYLGPETSVGEDCVIFPGVVVYGNVEIGNRVIIHSGAVLGSDGLGFVRVKEGWKKVPHRGKVIIEDDVEIGAGVTIDRGTIGATRIGRGSKIDNLVHIAHNVKIGERVMVAAQAGFSGSVKVEDDCLIGGQAGFVDYVKVGRAAGVAPQSGVHSDIPPGEIYTGTPAIPHREWLRAAAAFRHLPEIWKFVRANISRDTSRQGGEHESEK